MAEQQPKIGAGHASAMFRLGLRELRAVFFPESNVAQQSEYGVFGTRTPGEIAAARRDDPGVQRLEQEPKAASNPPVRSPSQIAADARGGVHGPEQHYRHEHEHGHGI